MNLLFIDIFFLIVVVMFMMLWFWFEFLGLLYIDGVMEGIFDLEILWLIGMCWMFLWDDVLWYLILFVDCDDCVDWVIIDFVMERYVGEVVFNEFELDDVVMNFCIVFNFGWMGCDYGIEVVCVVFDYVFDDLGVYCVGFDVFVFNLCVEWFYEKVGFWYEGWQCEMFFWDGEWVDLILMVVFSMDECLVF